MNTLTPPAPAATSVNHAAPVVRMEASVLTALAVVAPHQPAGTCTPLRGRISA